MKREYATPCLEQSGYTQHECISLSGNPNDNEVEFPGGE